MTRDEMIATLALQGWRPYEGSQTPGIFNETRPPYDWFGSARRKPSISSDWRISRENSFAWCKANELPTWDKVHLSVLEAAIRYDDQTDNPDVA